MIDKYCGPNYCGGKVNPTHCDYSVPPADEQDGDCRLHDAGVISNREFAERAYARGNYWHGGLVDGFGENFVNSIDKDYFDFMPRGRGRRRGGPAKKTKKVAARTAKKEVRKFVQKRKNSAPPKKKNFARIMRGNYSATRVKGIANLEESFGTYFRHRGNGASLVISARERIAAISLANVADWSITAIGQKILQFNVSPTSFPASRMLQFASMYQKYRFNRVTFHFSSGCPSTDVGSGTGNIGSGSIVGAIINDPADFIVGTGESAVNTLVTTRGCKPYSVQKNWSVTRTSRNPTMYFIDPKTVPEDTAEARQENQYLFIMMNSEPLKSTDANLGTLWIEYELLLTDPINRLGEIAQSICVFAAAGTTSSSDLIGTTPSVRSPTTIDPVFYLDGSFHNSLDLTAMGLEPGTYFQYTIRGAAGTSWTAPVWDVNDITPNSFMPPSLLNTSTAIVAVYTGQLDKLGTHSYININASGVTGGITSVYHSLVSYGTNDPSVILTSTKHNTQITELQKQIEDLRREKREEKKYIDDQIKDAIRSRWEIDMKDLVIEDFSEDEEEEDHTSVDDKAVWKDYFEFCQQTGRKTPSTLQRFQNKGKVGTTQTTTKQ